MKFQHAIGLAILAIGARGEASNFLDMATGRRLSTYIPIPTADYPAMLGLLLEYEKEKQLLEEAEIYTTQLSDRPCGSGAIQQFLIPQSFLSADFRPCCNQHDICYGTCGANKDLCDSAIGSCIRDTCDAADINAVFKGICRSAGGVAQGTLRELGGAAFDAAQSGACG